MFPRPNEAFSIPFYGFSDGSLGEKLETGMESLGLSSGTSRVMVLFRVVGKTMTR